MNDILICQCHSVDHQVVIQQIDDEIYLNVHLVNISLWKRIWLAIRYVFGLKDTYGHFEEFIINPDDADKLQNIVDVLRKQKEKEKEIEGGATADGLFTAEQQAYVASIPENLLRHTLLHNIRLLAICRKDNVMWEDNSNALINAIVDIKEAHPNIKIPTQKEMIEKHGHIPSYYAQYPDNDSAI